MIRHIFYVFALTCILNCAPNEDSEGVDVKSEFLEQMAGTYSSPPLVPNQDGLPMDELIISEKGSYTMTQYWHLDYPHETCVLVSDEIECSVEQKTTYCRITDTGQIDRVLDLQIKKDKSDKNLQAVTHIIEGMRSRSVLDDQNTYGESRKPTQGIDGGSGDNSEETPSSLLACREMTLLRDQRAGTQRSRYKVNWPDDGTLKFQHKTVPEKLGLGSFDVSGVFTKE